MKAAVLHGTNDMRYEDFPAPELHSGEVRIRVKACGLCGSDIPRITRGTAHYYPIVLGHEFAGVIEEIGPNAENLSIGQPVVGIPLVPCRECSACLSGHYSLCESYSFVGTRQQGGMAEEIVLPVENVFPIDASIPMNDAPFFEPATVALHGLRKADLRAGQKICIIGAGPIGIFALQWSRILGASSITAVGRSDESIRRIQSTGADYIFSSRERTAKEIVDGASCERGFDCVVDAVGTADSLTLALELAGPLGTVAIIGTPTDDFTCSKEIWEKVCRKELRLVGSWMSGDGIYPGEEWGETNRAFRDGELRVVPSLIGSQIPLSEVAILSEILNNPDRPSGRILIEI